ncbi:MAG: IclR family transcriptional regulator [Nocardioidaceae bacterium]|nr:IclR family transcriptional regulator [Nocardioidaceae bacterium]
MNAMLDAMDELAQGTQVVARVGLVLRTVGRFAPEGATTSQIASTAGLARPTAHRLLTALAHEGMLDRDPQTLRWFVGPEIYVLGAFASGRHNVTRRAHECVQALARATGESAFLSTRRGDGTLCLLREEGTFPIRSFVLYEGVRFPLGVASAGLAILSYLPTDEVDAYLARTDLEKDWGPSHAEAPVRERIAETRAHGYAVNPALVMEGSWGMGAAVFDPSGQPAWALSITGIESRFRPDRQAELGALLLEQAHLLSKQMSSPGE